MRALEQLSAQRKDLHRYTAGDEHVAHQLSHEGIIFHNGEAQGVWPCVRHVETPETRARRSRIRMVFMKNCTGTLFDFAFEEDASDTSLTLVLLTR
jgi:hypothetical protein